MSAQSWATLVEMVGRLKVWLHVAPLARDPCGLHVTPRHNSRKTGMLGYYCITKHSKIVI